MNNDKTYRSSKLRARLSFNDGYVESPIYSIKAMTTEKDKGLDMINLIMDNFNIVCKEISEYRERVDSDMLEEMRQLRIQSISKPLKLNRDDKGNLASPFATKKLE